MDDIVVKTRGEWAVLREVKRRIIMLVFKDSIPETVTSTFGKGFCARALVEGSWGFASTTKREDLAQALASAEELARRSQNLKKQSVTLAPVSPCRGNWHSPGVKGGFHESAIKELCESIISCQQEMQQVKNVVSSTVSFNIVTDTKTLCTSEGTHITQKEHRILGTISAVARNSQIASFNKSFGGQYGSEFLSKNILEAESQACAKIASRLTECSLPPSGATDVVLDSNLVGFLVHEAVGHTAEADIGMGGSYLYGKEGHTVAAESVTIVDDPSYPAGPGSFGYDEEGVLARGTILIKEGKFEKFLHNRETAFQMQAEPRGNARAWNFSCEPLIRMSNTFLEPGDHEYEELIEKVDDGYLVVAGYMGGQSDFNGEFMFGTGFCQKIEGGTLTDDLYRGPVITGNAFEVLQDIEAIGNSETFEFNIAICGKDQPAFVGVGGPPIKTKAVLRGMM
ncbi:MAG: TldD/PmbA family protein [Theionarchaea archaeon]|nr:TldD/PmbA family protein [Theionarchaea archaeon]